MLIEPATLLLSIWLLLWGTWALSAGIAWGVGGAALFLSLVLWMMALDFETEEEAEEPEDDPENY